MEIKTNVFIVGIIAFHYSFVFSCELGQVRNLNNLELRSPDDVSDYWDGVDDIVVNDAKLDMGWYRTVFNNWQYLLTDISNKPGYLSCQTYWPIYLKEPHPNITDIDENQISMTVCMLDETQPCSQSYQIQVRKCNGEIQYYLQTTAWLSGYCFEQHALISANKTPAPENVDLGRVTVLPELHFRQEHTKTGILKIPYVMFRCLFKTDTGLFYTIEWSIDGAQFKETFGPSTYLDSLILHEDVLISNKISLGIYIRCGVSVSSDYNGMRTSVVFSEKFYAGIKISNRNIFLDKESSAIIEMESTVPIGCRYLSSIATNLVCHGDMKIFVKDDDPFTCKAGSVRNMVKDNANQKCAQPFKTLSENDEWRPDDRLTFPISTSDFNYEDSPKFILKLELGGNVYDAIWKNYMLPDINVFVQNMTTYKSKICTSQNDPHMTTADGYSYEQQEKEGIYVLYYHMGNKIEVQQITRPCAGIENAKCTCGVAIRAGQDVFMINRCGTISFLGFTHCGDNGILDVSRMQDYLYRVFTPIGTRIEISLHGNKWMNVDITMAPKDMGHVYGLCGRVDGDCTNDLTHRDLQTVSILSKDPYIFNRHHPAFSSSWEIAENSDENLFNPKLRTLTPWAHENALYCVCNNESSVNTALCSPSQSLNCTRTYSITRTKCHIKGRKRRNVGHHWAKEIKRLLSKMTLNVPEYNRKRRQDDNEIVITEEATEVCARKLNETSALTDFKDINATDKANVVIDQCRFDVSVLNDTSWADIHLEAVNDGVKNMMDLQPTYVKKHTEEIKVFLKQACSKNCSGNGICSESGMCSCFTNYTGPDCSIDKRDGLTIFDIEGGGECDLADGDECECFYVRSDRIQEGFTCNVTTIKVFSNGDLEFISSRALKGEFEDIFTGICCAPEHIIGLDDVFVAKYVVSISNDGLNFGNEENVYVFDSTCQDISSTDNGSKEFTLKADYCFIDGYCFENNTMSLTGCLACQPNKASYNWTEYNPCQNGGVCTDQTDGYTCNCVDGYGGTNCEYEINECVSNPCNNGGNCTDKFDAYTCSCLDGFTGENCETNVDECSSNPCVNGAKCIDDVNLYHCECNAGFIGANCEQEILECMSNPCQNGGSCMDYVNGYTCECAAGFYGLNCSIDSNNCLENPCENGGSCSNQNDGRTCECSQGYTGVNCELNIYECASNPCMNGGSCVDLINGYACSCVPGHNGSLCENDIDECSSHFCQNEASCVDLINGYTCHCTSGYEGKNCDRNINECASKPCNNGGTCEDLIGDFNCLCAEGFEGIMCEINIDECISEPCKNGATCEDQVNGYMCKCAVGYEGIDCEHDIDECISEPCKNEATCEDQVNGYMCKCVVGYEGIDCVLDIDECISEPCKNGATCEDQVNGYVCKCAVGYEGIDCERDIDECSSNPCRENGIGLTLLVIIVVCAILCTILLLSIVCLSIRKFRHQKKKTSFHIKHSHSSGFEETGNWRKHH